MARRFDRPVRTLRTIACRECGTEIRTKIAWRRYCGPTCQTKAYWRRRVAREAQAAAAGGEGTE